MATASPPDRALLLALLGLSVGRCATALGAFFIAAKITAKGPATTTAM